MVIVSQNFAFKAASVASNLDYEHRQKIINCLPYLHLVERGFSAVTDLITKKRNRLQIVQRGDMRFHLTKNIEPNFKNLTVNDQAQPYHSYGCFIDTTFSV